MDYSKIKVIVVDDEPLNRRILVRLLTLSGFVSENIRVFSTTREAWDYLASGSNDVEIVFTDFNTKEADGANGYSFMRKIQDTFFGMKVVLVSGGHSLTGEELADFSGVLEKPLIDNPMPELLSRLFPEV